MSKFFRSGDSSSSDGEGENDGIDHADIEDDSAEAPEIGALSVTENQRPHQSGLASQSSGPWTAHHKDFLLHALLEDWCLNETLKVHEGASRDSPTIRAEAREKYQRMTPQLAALNVLPSGLDQNQYATARQRYRDGLNMLGQQQSDAAVSKTSRLVLTDGDVEAVSPNFALRDRPPPNTDVNELLLHAPMRRLLGHPEQSINQNLWTSTTAQSSLSATVQASSIPNPNHSRYHSEFEELRVLGHGGYGIVYHARNRLDNRAYAVKKVPISAARLRRIQTQGQREVDEILLELRTLARLHHPNIVRYHSAWVEWVNPVESDLTYSSAGVNSASDALQDVSSGAEEHPRFSLQRRVSKAEVDGMDIIFEDSGTSDMSNEHNFRRGSDEDLQLRRIGTRSTVATVSDETVESINRVPDVSTSIQSTAQGATFAQPTLAIHMQMSLHPFTLADLLHSKDERGECPKHCFHIERSVGIITAVLEGLDYLHGEGITHRDIKPANIFLSPKRSRGNGRDCVDLSRCGGCDGDKGGLTGAGLEVYIGDFGLAAVASSPEVVDSHAQSPVGTAIYRSATAEAAGPSLDIYALGVVLFELLWKFDTRMERHHIIHELKEGRYPHGFGERFGKERGVKVMSCIDHMLCPHAQVTPVVELKKKLHDLTLPAERLP